MSRSSVLCFQVNGPSQMWFAFLIMLVGLANLVLGFASAGYLGWGPRSWDEILLALMPLNFKDPHTHHESIYRSELDLQRLLDAAQQRMRKLATSKSTLDEPCQSGFLEINSQLERLEIRLDCIHVRILANDVADSPKDWQTVMESARHDLSEINDTVIQQIESWSQALSEPQQDRLGPFQMALCDELSRTIDSMPSIASDKELDEADREALSLWYHTSSVELSQICWQVRSLMRELLGECQSAIEWDPQLLLDRGHGMQSLAAFDAERRLNPTGETKYYVARCRIDQEVDLVPKASRILFRFAAERLAEITSPLLPGHWLIVPLGQGQWLVRGEGESVDEFVGKMDEIRQQLGQTELKVGETTFNFTTSWVVSLDSPSFETETFLLSLRQSIHDALRYGGNRTFVCEDSQPVPVMSVGFDAKPTTVEL